MSRQLDLTAYGLREAPFLSSWNPNTAHDDQKVGTGIYLDHKDTRGHAICGVFGCAQILAIAEFIRKYAV